ncbi:uncharacterized protein TNCV_3590431 [Trichonephila clavipes]|nr:uncharacterized protein TNCV_3590431 [Trichonephila clavipes]
MENTHRRPSGKRPKKRRFRGNQFMKVCSDTYVAERRDTKINRRSMLAMRCIGQGLESLKTFCAVMSLPNPVEQKSYDVINNKLSRVMKEVAEESMEMAAVEENSSSPDNFLTVSGDGTWKTRGHSSLIGVCTVIGAETDRRWRHKNIQCPSENKPYGDDHLIQKIECVGHVQKRMGTRLRRLKLVYSKKKLSDGKTIGGKGSVKEMRKAIWAVWGHSCSTDDEPMHWFCPTNPNTWYLSHPALLKKCLGGKTQNPNESLNSLIWKFCPKAIGSSLQIAEIAANLATSVFNDGNQILITSLEKFGLKSNRNVCVSLAERDNRRIFTSRQRRLESSFEVRRAKRIKKSKKIELFQEQEDISYDPGAF